VEVEKLLNNLSLEDFAEVATLPEHFGDEFVG